MTRTDILRQLDEQSAPYMIWPDKPGPIALELFACLRAGLIVDQWDSATIQKPGHVWYGIFMLTAAGRELCGLTIAVPEPVTTQRELF